MAPPVTPLFVTDAGLRALVVVSLAITLMLIVEPTVAKAVSGLATGLTLTGLTVTVTVVMLERRCGVALSFTV